MEEDVFDVCLLHRMATMTHSSPPALLRRRSLLLALPAMVALGASTSRVQAAGTVRFGMSAPFSGQAGVYGRQMKEGIDAAFAAINAKGGVHGQRLELIALDDGYETAPAVANARRLASQEKVFALMGFYGTASTTAVLPVLDEFDIPLIGTISGAGELRSPSHPHLFHLRASYGDETATIVKHLLTLNLSRIAVFYQDDGFGRAGLKGVRDALAAHSIEPVAVGSVPRNSVDVKEAVAAIAAKKPQAIVMVTLYRPTAEFIKQMRASGATANFIALSPVGTDQLIAEVGAPNARGVQVSQVIPSPWADKLLAAREYKRTLAQFAPQGTAVSYYGFEGYLNARLVAAALERAGSATRDRLTSALRAGPFDIGGYVVDFRPGSNSGSKYVEISVIGADGRILN